MIGRVSQAGVERRVQPRLQPRVQSRLLRVFVLQLALISLVTICGVLAAGAVAERVLVNQALVGEAAYFWRHRRENPAFALPDTQNLRAWFAGTTDAAWEPSTATERRHAPPTEFAALSPGQHRVEIPSPRDDDEAPRGGIVHVSEEAGERLYLLFDDQTVSLLAFWFGIVPLTLTLLIMYSLAYLAYRLSKRAVSPIVRLASVIERFDFNVRDAAELELDAPAVGTDSETRVLSEAIGHFVSRSKASIERERDFTRFASHELRTPVAVVRGSVEQLELLGLDGASGRAVDRIKRASGQMTALIDSLLALARERSRQREPGDEPAVELLPLTRRLAAELLWAEPMATREIRIDGDARATVNAPDTVLEMVIGNLLRNAWRHGGRGDVRVHISAGALTVADQGPGLNAEQRRRVFEPFYRVLASDASGRSASEAPERAGASATDESSTGRDGSRGRSFNGASSEAAAGSGLGLALVQRAAEHFGWTVAVHSEPGDGAIFALRFGTFQPSDPAPPDGAIIR